MGSKLQEAFEGGLAEQGVVGLAHCGCSVLCGHRNAKEVLEPGYLYVFFHHKETRSAVKSGRLRLSYGCVGGDVMDMEVAAEDVVEAVEECGLECMWYRDDIAWTTRMEVTLAPEDRDWLQTLVDEETQEEARMFRLSRLLDAWRRARFTRKIARKRIAEAFLEYGARPGGVLYKRARARFDFVQLGVVK